MRNTRNCADFSGFDPSKNDDFPIVSKALDGRISDLISLIDKID